MDLICPSPQDDLLLILFMDVHLARFNKLKMVKKEGFKTISFPPMEMTKISFSVIFCLINSS